jgi:hypothetical protein
MARATLRIRNETPWRTDHLRAFAQAARRQIYGRELRPTRILFTRSRHHVSGHATIGGTHVVVRVPSSLLVRREATERRAKQLSELQRLWLAQVLCHELAHNAGAQGERWMRRSRQYGWGSGWQENVAWARDLPLELTTATPKLALLVSAKVEAILSRIDSAERRWQAKAKRAATALKKLARRRAYYSRKLAALSAPSEGDK